MKIVKPDKKSRVDFIFVLILLVMFVSAMLLALMYGAGYYKSAGDRSEKRFYDGTTYMLLTGKFRAYDKADSITVIRTDKGDVIAFDEKLGGSGYRTYLYCENGKLCESLQEAGEEFDRTLGNELISADNMKVNVNENGLCEITLTVLSDVISVNISPATGIKVIDR